MSTTSTFLGYPFIASNIMKRKSGDGELESTRSLRKRARSEELEDSEDELNHDASLTPSKRRNSRSSNKSDSQLAKDNDAITHDSGYDRGSLTKATKEQKAPEVHTPKKRGRPKGSKNNPKKEGNSSAKSKIVGLFSTPIKNNTESHAAGTPSILRNLDRSARRKSARSIIDRTIEHNISDEEGEDDLARQIYDLDDENEIAAALGGIDEQGDEESTAPETPSKSSKRRAGRPKGSKNRQRSPTPPQDLAPHELYFSQNKSAHSKTSNNNLSGLSLLSHEEYFTLMRQYTDSHKHDLSFLQDLHARSFAQWSFELSQNFSVVLYGYGSKRNLLTRFASFLSACPDFSPSTHHLVIVNGYVHNSSLRDIFATISQALTGSTSVKLGSQSAEMLDSVMSLLSDYPAHRFTLLVNSLDSPTLRRPATLALLSRLCSHMRVQLLATADHPNFPLLFNSSLSSTFNFVFHDCTTFQPYADVEIDVVDEVHNLLGRTGRRVGGKEGVSFVLKSLPVKARQLFGVLVGEQLASMDEIGGDFGIDGDLDDDDFDEFGHGAAGTRRRVLGISGGRREPGVEYRLLYQKAVEDFICPNEMTFRTLLKEFYDHQMITSKKDVMGTETLSVPFRKEELETILEELMS